jgi:hypothetical protein
MEEISVRRPLATFALEQEKILQKHDDKLHWSNLTWIILLDRLDKERDELLLAIYEGKPAEEIRRKLDGWRCTEIEVTIDGLNEKWCEYKGKVILTRFPNTRQKITVFILLLIGLIKQDPGYREYVEKWVESTNIRIETLVEKYQKDPWGIVEETLWTPK